MNILDSNQRDVLWLIFGQIRFLITLLIWWYVYSALLLILKDSFIANETFHTTGRLLNHVHVFRSIWDLSVHLPEFSCHFSFVSKPQPCKNYFLVLPHKIREHLKFSPLTQPVPIETLSQIAGDDCLT